MTWDEYRAKFLASKGFEEKEVAEKIKNNEDLKLDEESKNRVGTGPDRTGSFCSPPHSPGVVFPARLL